jgi:uncharacterized phage protein gp47/JayE
MTHGITDAGFDRPTFPELLAEIKAAAKSAFGEDLDWSVGSPIAVFYGALVPELDALWQELESVYWANKIGGATGAGLEDLAAFQRLTRDPAQKASNVVTMFGDSGTVVPVGTEVYASLTGKSYITQEEGTLVGGQADILVEAEEEGPSYNCVAGVIDSLPSPVSGVESVSNVDDESTLQIARYQNTAIEIANDGASTNFQTIMKADIRHAHQVNRIDVYLVNPAAESRTVNVHIELVNHSTASPVAITQSQEIVFSANEGMWVSFDGLDLDVTVMSDVIRVALVNEETSDGAIEWAGNDTDPYAPGALYAAGSEQVGVDGLLYVTSVTVGAFTNGKSEESDSALARRFLVSKARGSVAIPEAIIADLWNIEGVRSVSFRQNREDIEVAGLRRRSIEVSVLGGATQDIAETLLGVVSAGIRTEGNVSVLVNDAYGQAHPIRFNRPTEVRLYIKLVLTKGPSFPAADGEAQVKDAVTDYIGGRDTTGSIQTGLNAGETVIVAEIVDAVMGIEGVQDVHVYLGTSADPTESTNVEVTSAQKAVANADDITVEVA